VVILKNTMAAIVARRGVPGNVATAVAQLSLALDAEGL
jgi:hypothetical protein